MLVTSRWGSSPLTRGALDGDLGVEFADGLIPAHAGSTVARMYAAAAFAAHPRSRGEHKADVTDNATGRGSSPLTRGAQDHWHRRKGRQGLIPAHAGSTHSHKFRSGKRGAHPRSRGEHGQFRRDPVDDWGSSPLTRGALAGKVGNVAQAGLIPAHAGSTKHSPTRKQPRRAHPRSRGEHWRSAAWFSKGGGAHPRSRGEHHEPCRTVSMSAGSSPLTRGAPVRQDHRTSQRGLIPAHAGSTVVAKYAASRF